MPASRRKYLPNYTYEDYLLWEGRWELIYGMPYAMTPSPLIKHQAISSKIARYLDEALENCESCQSLLPIDWKIDEQTIVQPDNLVICHKPLVEAYIKKTPKMIFEILSKSTAMVDKNLKYELYEQEGVNYYIIVDPQESIAKVYRLSEGRYVKLCDAHAEQVEFTLPECVFLFDFSKIW